jgi:hypothetical protein
MKTVELVEGFDTQVNDVSKVFRALIRHLLDTCDPSLPQLLLSL